MKILFLDIDGVLNHAKTRERFRGVFGINKKFLRIFNTIIRDVPDLKVVLSSTWRLYKDNREELKKNGIEYIDVTPALRTSFRGEEIKKWLEENESLEIEKFACIDDDSDFLEDQKLFKTSWKVGITQDLADEVIRYFNQ